MLQHMDKIFYINIKLSSIIGAGAGPMAGECTLDYDVIIENNGCAQACRVS